jgi:hypothetical protein
MNGISVAWRVAVAQWQWYQSTDKNSAVPMTPISMWQWQYLTRYNQYKKKIMIKKNKKKLFFWQNRCVVALKVAVAQWQWYQSPDKNSAVPTIPKNQSIPPILILKTRV